MAALVATLVPELDSSLYPVLIVIPIAVFMTAGLIYWLIVSNRIHLQQKGEEGAAKIAKRSFAHTGVSTVQDLFDDLPIALLRVTKDGQIKQTNQFSRNILGIREGDCPNISEIISGLARPVPEWLEELTERAARGEPKLVQVTGPKSEVFLHVSLISMDPRGGSDLIAVISDATELKTLEAQFVQSQKMQAIGQLAGGVAHDFNNLLTAISGYCDLLLLRHDKGDPDYSDLIQIHQNANRAAALVGQLLAFSRKQTLQPDVLNVDEALADMTHLLNRLLGAKIDLVLRHAENLPNVYVDKRQLEQVVMNLVVNARDAMPEGGQVDILTCERVFTEDTAKEGVTIPKGRYIEIVVSDNGCGIKPKNLSHIFDPFFTTKDVGEGTGLGLSTVYGIVKQTGGYIFADSALGQGTSFSVILPVTKHVEQPVVDTMTGPRMIGQSLKGTTVLLVEDEVPVRSFAARALAMQDVTVIEAGSAEEALKFVNDSSLHIDIFVSDVVMPGEDGPTWVRKALITRPDVKVVFVSGYAEETFSQEFGSIVGAKFLSKPFTLSSLIQTIHDISG
ncbi:ATP-binding protein [Amylibacter sp. SFDW26]|uniref:ATP-binding protein n=1 Tax=Amylibacter sp. SFDW26 TaxID=2652722 RepID=UPI00186A824A|nr:ATP-binding protein [Amylibacter sp. SFDW26]